MMIQRLERKEEKRQRTEEEREGKKEINEMKGKEKPREQPPEGENTSSFVILGKGNGRRAIAS